MKEAGNLILVFVILAFGAWAMGRPYTKNSINTFNTPSWQKR